VKKLFSTTIGSIFFVFLAFGQREYISIGLGPSLGIPVANKNFSYYFKNGIGGSSQANFGVSKLGSITINVLYVSIGAKRLPVTGNGSLTVIKTGYKTHFLNSRIFVGADAGIAKYGSGSSHFVIGGNAGYSFKISQKSYIDLFPSYNQIFGTGNNRMWLFTNILYRISLTKNKTNTHKGK
jgi:hypothetical protein